MKFNNNKTMIERAVYIFVDDFNSSCCESEINYAVEKLSNILYVLFETKTVDVINEIYKLIDKYHDGMDSYDTGDNEILEQDLNYWFEKEIIALFN